MKRKAQYKLEVWDDVSGWIFWCWRKNDTCFATAKDHADDGVRTRVVHNGEVEADFPAVKKESIVDEFMKSNKILDQLKAIVNGKEHNERNYFK